MRRIPFSASHDRPKASEWRWMEYSEPIPEIYEPASRLYAAIKKVAKIDQGTGSTFAALAHRGLIQLGEHEPDRYPHVRMTPAGRKLVRSWTGQKAYKAPPAGRLREWHWRTPLLCARRRGSRDRAGRLRPCALGGPEIEFAVLDYRGISEPPFWRGYGLERDASPAAQTRRMFYLLYELQK